ncbi:MAG: hypothetical protein OXC29_15345 [Rhodococcus sp.]|nr:hypothetical protein [Rhodococcus sp. (in: high G+C Gram-positive bacteria)]
MPENKRESPPITTAVAVNRNGTIAVRATEHAVPVDLRISQDELRYGGQRVAQQILTLCSHAAIEAGARHRVELEETGVPAAILDRLGLPTRDGLARVGAPAGQSPPPSWMRSI